VTASSLIGSAPSLLGVVLGYLLGGRRPGLKSIFLLFEVFSPLPLAEGSQSLANSSANLGQFAYPEENQYDQYDDAAFPRSYRKCHDFPSILA